jgi:hypothetical protein
VFTGQALKSKIKRASEDWLRFFALVSGVFSLRERCKSVPDIPLDKRILLKELEDIIERGKIMTILWGFNHTIQVVGAKLPRDADSFLLVLNPMERTLESTPYRKDQTVIAQEAYQKAEALTESDPNIHVVLVAVESVDALRKAYPNYYADTSNFISAVREEIKFDV